MKIKKLLPLFGSGLVLALLRLILNIGFNGAPLESGGCVCVSFDKWNMLTADRLVLCVGNKQYESADTALIRSVAWESAAGTHNEYCCSHLDDGWIEIYKGDHLIRRMRWIRNHGSLAYEADPGHWVLFGDEAHAFLSEDVCAKLEAIIREN